MILVGVRKKLNDEVAVLDKEISKFDEQLTNQTPDGENNKFTRSSIGYYRSKVTDK